LVASTHASAPLQQTTDNWQRFVYPFFWRTCRARRRDGEIPGVKMTYAFSEVFDLKPTSGLYLKNSAHLSDFLTPRTVSVVSSAPIEHSAYFDLTSLQKCEEGEVIRSNARFIFELVAFSPSTRLLVL
jgi:hypothetical protein